MVLPVFSQSTKLCAFSHSDLDEDDASNDSECNGPALYSEIAKKPDDAKSNDPRPADSRSNDAELIRSYLNRAPKRGSISKNASLKGNLTPNRSSSTNLSVNSQANNMKVPLLVNSTGKSLIARQLPIRSSLSPDTLSRTSDTFKGQPDVGGKPGTFSSLSTLKKRTTSPSCKPPNDKPTASRKKFYYDSQGHRIQVRSTIEDFLKKDDEDCKPDDDARSYSSCSLRDSSLNIRQNWAKLPFY